MTDRADHLGKEPVVFEGEEAGAGYANPILDLVAAVVLLMISGAFMIGSLQLPVPGSVMTAPGLLPFLTAATLGLMALALAWSAVERWRRAGELAPLERDAPTERRTLALAVCVFVYIAVLQFAAFRYDIVLADVRVVLSAFEPATIVVLVALMTIFWRGPLWISVSIAVPWTLFLSLVFREVFHVPLPGS